MKTPTIDRPEPVSQWAAPPKAAPAVAIPTTEKASPSVATTGAVNDVHASVQLHDEKLHGDEFDVLGIAKMLGMEFWNHIFLKIVFSMFVARMLVPLAIIATNDMSGIEFWAGIVAVLLAPLCYAFFIAKSDKPYLITRLCIQWVLFAVGFVLVSLLGIRGLTECLLLIAATGGLLAGAAFLGCQFIKSKTPDAEDAAAGKASLAGFAKETLANVLGIGLGLSLCVGSHLAASSLQSQAQAVRFVGKPAPALNFISSTDEDWSLENQQGKVVVVEYWSPHCLPCVAAIGTLEQVHTQFSQHKDFELVSVSLGNKESSIEIHETIEDPWALVFPAEPGELGFKPAHIPMAYIIDRDGTVYAAGISADQLDAELSKLFAGK